MFLMVDSGSAGTNCEHSPTAEWQALERIVNFDYEGQSTSEALVGLGQSRLAAIMN